MLSPLFAFPVSSGGNGVDESCHASLFGPPAAFSVAVFGGATQIAHDGWAEMSKRGMTFIGNAVPVEYGG